jgi:hypothetical protein
MKGRWLAAVGVLLAIHLVVVAAVFTPAPHSGGDNAAYLSLGASLLSGAGYVELWDPAEPPHAKYPPAYPVLLAFAMALGATTWGAFKVLSGVLVVTGGALVLAWAGTRRGPVFGGVVALLTVLSAGWIEASRWVLSEPLFLVGVFVALWGADRAGLRFGIPGRRAEPPGAEPPGASEAPEPDATSGRWVAFAAVGAVLTLFTRTAGLPLLLALLVLLAWTRRWKALAVTAGAAALPVLLWIVRGRSAGEGAYQDEFWLANPYDPALGTVGVAGLADRVVTNLELYLGHVLGVEWWGRFPPTEALAGVLGVLLVLVALAGWGTRIVKGRAGLAELFLPLYGGLVLLWPQVWSGDRFVLPLYPLLLFWAGEALLAAGSWLAARAKRPRLAPAGAVAGAVALAIPAGFGAFDKADLAGFCRGLTTIDPYACYGETFQGFRDAAEWSAVNLPATAVVINRRPRTFFAMGGPPGRVFPFFEDAEPLLELADEVDARYLLVDEGDGISQTYLPAIVRSQLNAFCWIREWQGGAVLLGILPPEARAVSPQEDGTVAPCDLANGSWVRAGFERNPRVWGHQVPVVVSRPLRRPR